MQSTWYKCTSLLSFPHIDTSSVVNMHGTWWWCSSLTSFPFINTGSVVAMNNTWRDCLNLSVFNGISSCLASTSSTWYNTPNLNPKPCGW